MPNPSYRTAGTWTLAIALLALAGCQPPESAAPPAAAERLSQAELANATYAGINDTPVSLTDGAWTGPPFVAGGASAPRVGLVEDFRVDGDLNNDGQPETAVLLWTSSGGSGTYDYAAIVGRDKDGTARNLGTAALGDRVRVWTGAVVAGNLVLDVIQAGPDDAACCPGEKVRRTFALGDGGLAETATDTLGRLSVADLGGVEWVLRSIDTEPMPAGVEVTLTFADDRIAGSSGCNLYSGAIDTGELPGQLTVRLPMVATLMACAPPAEAIEQRYRDALGAVTQYSLRAGQLILTAIRDGEIIMLRFDSRPL